MVIVNLNGRHYQWYNTQNCYISDNAYRYLLLPSTLTHRDQRKRYTLSIKYHILLSYFNLLLFILKKWKTKYITLSELFQNPLEKSYQEAKSIPPNIHRDVIVLFICFGEGYSIKCGGVIIACNFSSIYEYICNIFQYQFLRNTKCIHENKFYFPIVWKPEIESSQTMPRKVILGDFVWLL